MKRLTIALILTVPVLLLAAAPPENVTLGGCGDKQADVEFPHGAHVELTECTTCHHTSEGLTADSDMEVPTCVSCHASPAEEGVPDCSQMSPTKNPYHKNCMGCHKEQGKGPTKCTECHPKG